jgi:ferredoxin
LILKAPFCWTFIFPYDIFKPLKILRTIFEREVKTLAYTINQDCINCGACDDSCPVGAISEAGDKRVIDADNCIDCGACVDTCPVSAIVK